MTETPLLQQARRFISALPHCQIIGLSVHAIDHQGVTLVLPYSPAIVGNPQTGVIHGGAVTTLMDTTCGIATLCVLPQFEVCPTLDLRIDYIHPAQAHKAIYGYAQCYRVTRDVIFTRGYAYQDSAQQPIAQVVGTFMRLGKAVKGSAAFAGALGGQP
ncbi:PaaI family thioesterase [Pseudomonas sp. TE3610]